MKIGLKLFAGLALFVFLFGCENRQFATDDMLSLGESNIAERATDVATPPPPPPPSANAPDTNSDLAERKLIKEGFVAFETDDLKTAREHIVKVVKKYNAYLSSDNEYRNDRRVTNEFTIRIPVQNFEKFLNELSLNVSKFDSKEIKVIDVTSRFIDMQSRLRTKKQLEQRYLQILKKANSVTEILAVERQIGELRTDIEAIEGQFKYLKKQINFSTLTVRVYEKLEQTTKKQSKFVEGFKNGWDNLVSFLILLISLWPFILIFVGVFVFFKIWRKGRKSKKIAEK